MRSWKRWESQDKKGEQKREFLAKHAQFLQNSAKMAKFVILAPTLPGPWILAKNGQNPGSGSGGPTENRAFSKY
jgi:hypothetical protein